MNKLLTTVLTSTLLLGMAQTVAAHGGIYRGPGDTVPPGIPGRTPKSGPPKLPPITPGGTPVPTPPGTVGPPTPITPPKGTPSSRGGGGPNTSPRRAPIGDDLTRWQFWWEFNKDRYLRLRDSLYDAGPVSGVDEPYMGGHRQNVKAPTLRPSKGDIEDLVLPALRRALQSTQQRDIRSSCLMAMAKTRLPHKAFSVLDLMRDRIRTHDQEVRETCAVAMGISGLPGALQELQALALDTSAGRKRTGQPQVDDRTRTFAVYGLGLIAHGAAEAKVKLEVLDTAKAILANDRIVDRNIRVAAINAIGLLKPADSAEATSVLHQALDVLDAFYARKLGRGQEMIQSHVPPAIAKLLGRGDHGRRAGYLKLYQHELLRKGSKKASNDIYRAAALALGQLTKTPRDDEACASSKALLHYFHKGKNQQARYFSVIALGQIGGAANRNQLLTILAKGKKVLERPWAALALGVYRHDLRKTNADSARDGDETVGLALLKQFETVRAPSARAAFAIALGLCRYKDAGPALRKALEDARSQAEFAGYICIGLALMDARKAKEQIHELVMKSTRRPELLKQAAMALGKLGDRNVSTTMLEMLQGETQNLARLGSIANALAYMGDRRSIRPLIQVLQNEELGDLSRAFAAVALGGVADPEDLRWNTAIAANMNYRAAVETLTGSATGVLDIF